MRRVRLTWLIFRCGIRWKRKSAKREILSQFPSEASRPDVLSPGRVDDHGVPPRALSPAWEYERPDCPQPTSSLTGGNDKHSAAHPDNMTRSSHHGAYPSTRLGSAFLT